MFSLDPFRTLCKTLGEPLPPSVQELRIGEYELFLRQLTSAERETVKNLFTTADDATRTFCTLPVEAQGDLRSAAIASLVAIRHKQQACMLFADLDGSIDKEFFRNAASRLDGELLPLALSVKERLPSARKRLILLQMLNYVPKEHREQALNAICTMLSMCTDHHHAQCLSGCTALAAPERMASFLQDLAVIFTKVNVNQWPALKERLLEYSPTNRLEVVHHTARMLPPNTQIAANALLDILSLVRGTLQTPERLQDLYPILGLCTDCAYVPAIIQNTLDMADDNDRTSLIATLRNILCYSGPSLHIHHVLIHVRQLSILMRIELILQHAYAHRHDAPRQDQHIVLHLSRRELIEQPVVVLNRLVALIDGSDKTSLRVVITDEPAIDLGGPAREVIHDIVSAICKLFQKKPEALFRPQSLKLTVEQQDILQKLGKLFMFCLNSQEGFNFGEEIDPAIFMALTKIREKHLHVDFENLDEETFMDLFEIYEAMNSVNVDDARTIQEHAQHLSDPDRRACIAEAMQQDLTPCFAIWQGMKESRFTGTTIQTVQKMIPLELEERLQGVLTAKKVVEKFEFPQSVPMHTRGWVKEWILSLDKPKLQKLLKLMIGVPALNKGRLSIEFHGKKVAFSTCAQCITLPAGCGDNKATLHDMLNFALKTEETFTKG